MYRLVLGPVHLLVIRRITPAVVWEARCLQVLFLLSRMVQLSLLISKIRILVEIFLNGGKIAMTNLIFPTTPYNQMSFYSRGGAFKVDRCKIYRL